MGALSFRRAALSVAVLLLIAASAIPAGAQGGTPFNERDAPPWHKQWIKSVLLCELPLPMRHGWR